MRLVVLDTETTGLESREGHRIIEVGAIEVVARRITERRFHHYVNPERDSDEGALAVHGLNRHFLEDKPKFGEIADDLLAFVRDAEVVIHNAAFDIEFPRCRACAPRAQPTFAAALPEGDRFAAARARAASWQAQLARRAVRTLRRCRMRIEHCTALCSMPGCWPTCTSR